MSNYVNAQRIVDAHVHWWDLERNYYPWLMDRRNATDESGLSGAESIAKTYLPAHYLADSARFNVLGVVHVEAAWDPADPLGETRWLTEIADQREDHGLLAAVVPYANLALDDCEGLLEAHAAHARVRSIRQMLNHIPGHPAMCWATEDFTVHPNWLRNFPLLGKYALGFDLMCFANMMHRMADLAHGNPDVKIYLEHCGMPYQHDDAGSAAWRSGMQALAANDNVVAKLSGLGTTVRNWTESSIRPYVLETIDIFGIDRVMFATNFPTDKLYSSMDTLLGAYLSILSGFSQHERDLIFADNAVRHYRLALDRRSPCRPEP
jgi:predicted TIM-barrel fold metal-dependent hydrolase